MRACSLVDREDSFGSCSRVAGSSPEGAGLIPVAALACETVHAMGQSHAEFSAVSGMSHPTTR